MRKFTGDRARPTGGRSTLRPYPEAAVIAEPLRQTTRISRRRFGGAVTGLAVTAGSVAASPRPQIPGNREEELAAALARNRLRAKDLDEFELPMMTEPAFVFEA